MSLSNAHNCIDQLIQLGNTEKAAQMAAYHKVARRYLGIDNPTVTNLANQWRSECDLETRVALAKGLWESDIFEARLAAIKLLTQARIRPDGEVWNLIISWVAGFDSWALADHACSAGSRRIMADLSRLDEVETWSHSDHLWTKRAALVITLPLSKRPFPKPDELEARERVLSWAASYVDDNEWFIQKAVAWWIRDMSKHDAERAQVFLEQYGDKMKAFARKEASKHL